MGYTSALDMAANTDLNTAVEWHLQYNCYPPVPVEMASTAVKAIEACVNEEPDILVELPEGVAFKDGRTAIAAFQVVELLRLNAFVEHQMSLFED